VRILLEYIKIFYRFFWQFTRSPPKNVGASVVSSLKLRDFSRFSKQNAFPDSKNIRKGIFAV